MRWLVLIGMMMTGTTAWAVTEPSRNSVADTKVMQIDEPRYLGNRLTRETRLVDADGSEFTMGDVLGKPVILLLSYFGCDGTCPTMNLELAKVLKQVKRFRLGEDYRVLTVSFDSRDTPQTAQSFLKKTQWVPEGMQGGWRHAVLKGLDPKDFAGGVGFSFFWSEAANAFLHPNALVFLTPEGRVARYIYGIRMDVQNIELALLDADWNRIANSTAVFDQLTGVCFSFNYAEGRYQLNYSLLAGIGSLLLGLVLLGLGSWAYSRKMRRTMHAH